MAPTAGSSGGLRSPGFALRNASCVVAFFMAPLMCSGALHCARPHGQRAHPHSAQVTQRTFGDTVGLNVKFSQGEPQTDLPLLEELGVKWVRDNVDWSRMEPSPGRYAAFPPAFQERLAFYKAHGVGVVFGLWYDNPRAYPNTPDHPHASVDAAAYGRYAAAIARRLNASGVRFVLEIWNEPHNFVLQKLMGGSWNAKPPSPWVDQYLAMVREAVTRVKAYDPNVRLLDDEDMWISHYWFLEKGLPRALDGFAFHPYSGSSSIGPEVAAVDQNTDWAKPFTLVDADRSFRSAVRRLRDRGRSKLGRTPDLWATEWGWALGEKSPRGPMSEEMLAGLLPRAFIAAADAGVEVLCWFSSEDSVDGPMGLLRNDGRRRETFAAFATMTHELGACRLVRHVTGADHPTSGVQAYLFRGPTGYKLVVWDIDGRSVVSLDRRGAVTIRAVDVQGRPVPDSSTPDGRPEFAVSPSPIYVSTGSEDAALIPEPAASVRSAP